MIKTIFKYFFLFMAIYDCFLAIYLDLKYPDKIKYMGVAKRFRNFSKKHVGSLEELERADKLTIGSESFWARSAVYFILFFNL